MRYLIGHNDVVAGFVAAHIPGCSRGFGAKIMTLGVIDGKRLIGGLVYHNYDPEAATIEISGAAIDPRWLTRTTLRLMHVYPFVDARCQMVVMRVSADNARLLRQLKALGYKRVTVERLFGRDRDGVVATLTDDVWKSRRIHQRVGLMQHQEAA
jgi:RimJ/RimL family protein N-acetyltransferase